MISNHKSIYYPDPQHSYINYLQDHNQPQPDCFDDPPDMLPVDDAEWECGGTSEIYRSLSHSPVKDELMSVSHTTP